MRYQLTLTSAHADGGWPGGGALHVAGVVHTLAAGFSSISTLCLRADEACAELAFVHGATSDAEAARWVLARLDALPAVLFDGGANATAAYDDHGAFGGACDDGLSLIHI